MTIQSIDISDISCISLVFIFLTAVFFIGQSLLQNFSNIAFALLPDSEISTKSKTPINHIIVISQGKRSFDNYFGTFPGANGYPGNVGVPLNPFPQPASHFTLGAWFSTNNTFSKSGFLINKGGLGVDTPGKNMNYGIWMNKKGNIISGFENKSGVDYVVASNKTYNDGEWHNVIVTYDGDTLRLFMDGMPTAYNRTGGASPDVSGIQPIRIGSNSLNLSNYFTGLIDEIRIWNRTLEYSEILKGYNNNTYDTNGQVIYLPFGDGSDKNAITNASTSLPELDGIYMNGSSYRDVTLQHTSYFKPFSLNETQTDAPADGSTVYEMSYNNRLMNGFLFAQHIHGKDPNLVLGYYDDEELPYYWQFASDFVLADNFFAPSMDTGLGVHQYLYTASSMDYQKNASFRGLIDLNMTIFDKLNEADLSWKVYVEDYDPTLNYTNSDTRKNRYVNLLTAIPRFVDNRSLNSNIVDLVKYFQDLNSNNFPAVSYIVAPNSDESSPRDAKAGQEFVASLVLALMKSKHWEDSVFVLTYRESGGWYDHVKPPVLNGERYGFRVPTLIISPFAKEGYVDSTIYDSTSILKFIEYNYDLSPLSTRDAYANNLLNAFDFNQAPRKASIYNASTLGHIDDGSERKIQSQNVIRVYYLYLIIVGSMTLAGLVFWHWGYRGKAKLNSIKDNRF